MRGNRGSTPIIIICSLFVLVMLSAVITDIGYVAYEQFRLTKTARTAAVMGAKLLTEKAAVKEEVTEFTVREISELNQLNIDIPDSRRAITVELSKPVKYIFLRLFKVDGKTLTARATAKVSTVCRVKGIRPFVIQKGSFHQGQEAILSSAGAAAPKTIPFVPLKLKDGYYKLSIMYGYNSRLKVGDGIYAYTGEYGGLTLDALRSVLKSKGDNEENYRVEETGKKKIFLLPVVDKLVPSGTAVMNIVGFTAFEADSAEMRDNTLQLKGRFLKYLINAATSDGIESFGLSGVELVGS